MRKKVLIAGASRGIGLELAVQYAADDWHVIAGCRDPKAVKGWLPAGVEVQQLDVTCIESVQRLASCLGETPLDRLIVSAGIADADNEGVFTPDIEEFDLVMHTNVMGGMLMISSFGPLVAKAQGRIILLSSEMGSISNTVSTAKMLYRCSKAALNMLTKIAACEYGPQNVVVAALHPGWVRTDMGGPKGLLSVSESVERLRDVIGNLDSDDNGCFLDYTGSPRDW